MSVLSQDLPSSRSFTRHAHTFTIITQLGIMGTLQTDYRTYIVLLLNNRDKRTQDNNTLSPSPRSNRLLLSSSFLPPPQDIRVSTNPSYPPPPLCHLSTRPSGGSLRDGKNRVFVCLMRRSPQLHGASASPACRHAAIHRLITMKERSRGWLKVGCTDCNQLPVAVFLCTTYHILVSACSIASSTKSYHK